MMEKKKRIIVKEVGKTFKIGFRKSQGALARFLNLFSGKEPKKIIHALKNVSFSVEEGEIIGLIGKNGAGKSTLLRVIARIYSGDDGFIKTNGKIVPIINLNVGMQPRLTMKDNIYLCCALFGLSRKEIKEKFQDIVKFSELEEFINTKMYQFSEGMKQRLAFSIAIYCNPEILLLDEIFEVGDEEFKRKSANKIKEIVKKGASVLLVSHSLDLIEKYCDRAILLDFGKIIKDGKPKEVIKTYLRTR